MDEKILYEPGFGILSKAAMIDNTLSIQAKGLYAYLVTYAGSKNNAFPGRNLVMHQLNISKDTFTKYIKELKDKGYINIIQESGKDGKFGHNIYYINPCPKISDTETPDTDYKDIKKNSFKKNSFKNNNIKKKKETEFDEIIKSYTSNANLKSSLYDFIKFRKGIRADLTSRALVLLIKNLDKLTTNDNEKIEILNQSIVNGWRGVFELKRKRNDGYGRIGKDKSNNSKFKGLIEDGRVKLTEEERRRAEEELI